jgi:prepilin-type N-terminal cleavage/methylation domain-containing protein
MKNRNFRTLKSLGQRQAGYTLVELAITVSIISLLVVSSIAGVQGLLLANKVNRTLTQTTVATASITKLIAATNNANLATADLIKLGAWDVSALRDGGTSVENPFSGKVQVAPNSKAVGSLGAGSGYFYYIAGVPESHCASLVTSFYTTSPGIYIKGSTTTANSDPKLGDTPKSNADGGTTGYKIPGALDSLDNLKNGCKAGAGTDGLVEVALFIPT